MSLTVSSLRFSYGSSEVLKGIDAEFMPGINGILGPNGAGKSTLAKCMAGVLKPAGGTVRFAGGEGKPSMSYLAQDSPPIRNLSVLEYMLLGRADELGLKVTGEDIDIAYRPLEKLGIDELAEKDMGNLSGGQRQMVAIAQCLVSEPDFIILDEPTNNLDLRRELDIFQIMRAECDDRGITCVMILHDLNFASRFSDRIVVMNQGEVYSSGTPAETVTEDMLRVVYGVEAEISVNSRGIPNVEPIRSVSPFSK
jgi:iron complex transport system ATP-binding protein